MRRLRRLLLAGVTMTALVLGGGRVIADGTADLAITHMTVPDHAPVGQTFTVRILAVNHGPAVSSLFVHVTATDNVELGLLDCNFRDGDQAGGGDGANLCELDTVPVGAYTTTVTHGTVRDRTAATAAVTACTDSGGDSVDPKPHNDCRTARLAIDRP